MQTGGERNGQGDNKTEKLGDEKGRLGLGVGKS